MDWPRVKAALIRAFWAFVFPAIGYAVTLVLNALQGVDVTQMSWGNAAIIAAVSAALYGLKKQLWPDTEW